MSPIVYIILPCIISMLIIYHLTPFARKYDLLDKGNTRKLHTGEIPLLGGTGIIISIILSTLIFINKNDYFYALCTSLLIIYVIGLIDDLFDIKVIYRFLCHIAVAIIFMQFGNVMLVEFGDILHLGNIKMPILFSWVLTIIAISGIINAMNMLDGIDGLAGITAITQLSLLSAIAYQNSLFSHFKMLLIIIGAILGFLAYNLPIRKNISNKVFLGDNGSMQLGVLLSYFLISFSQTITETQPVQMLWIMIIPIFDTIHVMLARVLRRQSPFQPDRNHLHHLLSALKIRDHSIVIIYSITTIIFGSGAVFLLKHMPEWISFCLFCIASAIFTLFKNQLNKKAKRN